MRLPCWLRPLASGSTRPRPPQRKVVVSVAAGKAVLSAGTDKTLRIWEYPSGKALRRIGSHVVDPGRSTHSVFWSYFPVALSPDGKTVAACFEWNKVRVLDVATGEELQTLNR